jgi:HK97 family phage major capsid protein
MGVLPPVFPVTRTLSRARKDFRRLANVGGNLQQPYQRQDADSLIPKPDADSIIKLLTQQSVALSLFRRAAMSSKTLRQPVLSALGAAYWVSGDTGLKQTTEILWDDCELIAEEIAAIIPIPEAVVADSGYPVFAEVKEAVAEAVAVKLDSAVFAGVDKPPTWPTAIAPAAIAAGNTHTAAATADAGGIADDMAAVFRLGGKRRVRCQRRCRQAEPPSDAPPCARQHRSEAHGRFHYLNS